jgi:hypothetical protein
MKADPEAVLMCPAGEGCWASAGVDAARIIVRTPLDRRRPNIEPPLIKTLYCSNLHNQQMWSRTYEIGTISRPICGDCSETPLPSVESAPVVPKHQ